MTDRGSCVARTKATNWKCSTLVRPIRALALALVGLGLQSAAVDAQERAKIEIVPQIAHARDIETAALSRNGAHLLTGSADGTLKLWDVATTRLVRTFSGHKGDVTAVALSPDSTRALSGSKDKTIRLWEVATGRLIRTIYAHLDSTRGEVSSVAFSPDGKRLLSSSGGEDAAKLWDAETGRLVRMFQHAKGSLNSGVTSAVFSPDGTRMATGGAGDKIVNLWNTETGQLVQAFGDYPATFSYQVRLAFSPDGTRLLVADNTTLKVWEAATGTLVLGLRADDPGESRRRLGGRVATLVAFSADGVLALSNSFEHGLEFWSLETGQHARTFKPKLGKFVAVSPDGKRAVSGEWGSKFKVWDVASEQLLHTFEGHSISVSSVATSPDGAHLLTVDQKVRLWDAANGRLARTIKDQGQSVVFSPDGARLLAASYNSLKLWDAPSGQLVLGLKTSSPDRVAFSPDGSRLLAFVSDPPSFKQGKPADRDSAVVTWDMASGKPVHSFKVQSSTGLRPPVAFSRDGTRFLPVPNSDQPLTVWDVASEQVLHTFGGRGSNHMYSAAFSPDNAQLATGHIDGSLKLWEVATGRLIRTLWHAKAVDAVAFSRDGTKLLSGSADTTVKLWDTATGQGIRTFEGHSANVRSVAFTPDEKRIISGGYDTTARVWDIATGEQLALLLTAKEDEWLVITPEGFFDASPKGAEMLTVVRGLEVFGIDQFYQALYRPDLVREKLAGDPDGKVAHGCRQAGPRQAGRERPRARRDGCVAQGTGHLARRSRHRGGPPRRPGRRHRPHRVAHQRRHRRRGRACDRRRGRARCRQASDGSGSW